MAKSVRNELSVMFQVTLQSVLIAIDVVSPQIIELLLKHGADCGPTLDVVGGCWGQPLLQALNAPLKSPREPFKQMFRLLAQATVSGPSASHGVTSVAVSTVIIC
jgi:hypothetical protein